MSPQGKEAYAYLIRRGRDRKTIRHFGLGYSPKGWDELIRHLKSKGFSEEEMLEANVGDARPAGASRLTAFATG